MKFHPLTPVRPERLVRSGATSSKGMRLDPSGVLTVMLDRHWPERRRGASETYCFRWKRGAKISIE